MSVPDPLETVRELATHASDIKHLQADMDKIVKDMQDVKDTLEAIRKTLDQAHGGWRMLIAVGSAAALVGGCVAWFIEHVGK
jgi:prefoldin subunit 5